MASTLVTSATGRQHTNPVLFLDEEAREVSLAGQPITLTRLEFDLLAELYARPRRVFTPTELLQAIWGADWVGDERAAEVYVSRIRRKLGESARHQRFIHTVHGVGYRYVPADPPILPTKALFDETGALVLVSPPTETILGWPVRDIIGTRFIPTTKRMLNNPHFIAAVNRLVELVNLSGFTLRTSVKDRDGAVRDVDIDATFVYHQGRVAGLSVDYRWCD